MADTTLLYVIAAAVGVSALAIIFQAVILFAAFRQAKALNEQISMLAPRIESTLESAQRNLEHNRKQVAELCTKASEVLDLARTQLVRVDGVLDDATKRAKIQMERVELVLDDSISRLHQTVALLHSGILRPLKEINGVAAGIRGALHHLLRGGRPSVAQATHDDEMFI